MADCRQTNRWTHAEIRTANSAHADRSCGQKALACVVCVCVFVHMSKVCELMLRQRACVCVHVQWRMSVGLRLILLELSLSPTSYIYLTPLSEIILVFSASVSADPQAHLYRTACADSGEAGSHSWFSQFFLHSVHPDSPKTGRKRTIVRIWQVN